MDHCGELVDGEHHDGVAECGAQTKAGLFEALGGAGALSGPHDIGKTRHDAVKVDRIGLDQTVGEKVKTQVSVGCGLGPVAEVGLTGDDGRADLSGVVLTLHCCERFK